MTKYAYHLETKRVQEPDFPYVNHALSTPQAVADFARSLQDSDIEKFLVLYLTTTNKLICIQIQPGTIDRAAIYPREIAKHALLSGAASVILVHNHPSASNTVESSQEDRAMTRIVRVALELFSIRVLDHIIISGPNFLSMQSAGQI